MGYWSEIWGSKEEIEENEEETIWTTKESSPLPGLTREKVREKLMKYPKDKSPGIDGIHGRIVRVLATPDNSPLVRHLTDLFEMCAGAAYFPKRWGNSMVTFLAKKKDAPPSAPNLRPISLMVHFRRIFEQMVVETIEEKKVDGARLHWGQAGFRRGFSCEGNLLALDQFLVKISPKISVFLDFQGAYNT